MFEIIEGHSYEKDCLSEILLTRGFTVLLKYAFLNKVPYPEVKEARKSNMET